MTGTPLRLPERIDAVVIGGGIVGLSVAEQLSSRGLQTALLDRSDGRESASRAAAGMLAPATESDVELPGLGEFRRLSHSLYPSFVARVEAISGIRCDLRREGSLFAAVGREDEPELERLADLMGEEGFPVRPLSAPEAIELEPRLTARVTRGLLVESDWSVHPRRLLEALRRALEIHGALVPLGAVVHSADEGGLVRGALRRHGTEEPFAIRGGAVVVAAGSWTHTSLESPFSTLPLRPVRGQLILLDGPDTLRRTVRTPRAYLVPRDSGELVVGATVEEQGFDLAPTAGGIMDLLRRAWELVPGIYDLAIREICVGVRPAARDGLPIIGCWKQTALYVATGHYRNGILLAPGTAQLLGDLIAGGKSHPLIEHFTPHRFQKQPAGAGAAGPGR